MKQISFIHMADLHLGAAFSSLADAEKAEERRRDIEKCLEAVVERARNQNIQLLFISGDFFEDSTIRGSVIMSVKNLFSELYKTEIILCPGNHDPLKERSYYRAVEWGSNVHILENSQQVLYLEKYNTCIYTLGAKGDATKDYEFLRSMAPDDRSFNILLFHGTVDIPFEDNYNSVTSDQLFSLGMDYIALGHMHRYFKKQNGKTVMINPGSPEPLGFDEEGKHGIIQGVATMDEDHKKVVETTFISTQKRHYHNIEINITDCNSDGETFKKVLENSRNKLVQEDLYSIVLKGFIPKDYIPGIRNIAAALEKRCFYVRIKNQTSVRFDFEEFIEDPGIKGEFVRRLIDRIDEESTEKGRETLYMALQYGLQALEMGRVDW